MEDEIYDIEGIFKKLGTSDEIKKFIRKYVDTTNPYLVYEIISCYTPENREEIKDALKKSSEFEIISSLPTYKETRRTIFIQTLETILFLGEKKKGIYICPKCKSDNTVTETKQTRSGDEPLTDTTKCQDCGNVWHKN